MHISIKRCAILKVKLKHKLMNSLQMRFTGIRNKYVIISIDMEKTYDKI